MTVPPSSHNINFPCLPHLEASTSPIPKQQLLITSLYHNSAKITKMKFTTLTGALALFATAVSALDKPLNIQVDKAVECSRKTKAGEWKS